MAADPTWAETWTQMRAAVKLLRETFNYGSQNTPNLVDLIDDVITNAKGAHAPRMTRAAAAIRSGLSDLLVRGRDLLDPLVLELGRIIGSPHTASAAILDDLHDYMVDQSETVVRRNLSRGSVSAGGSNTGDGTVYACTVDADDIAIEDGGPYVTTLECIADQNTGTPSGAALFDVSTSGAPAPDLVASGAGLAQRLTVRARIAADGLLGNPGFRSYNSSATHPFAPWLTSGGSYTGISQVASGVRPDRGTTTPANPDGTSSCAKLDGNNLSLYQVVTRELDPARPHALVLWYRPENSCDGTLYVQLGSQSANVSLSGKSGWNRLAIATGDKCHYANFRDSPLTVQVWIENRTTGYVLVDEALLAPMDYYNGRWLAVVTGEADFEVGDVFTFSDTSANDLNIQGWLNRVYGAYLPHASSGVATIADPS